MVVLHCTRVLTDRIKIYVLEVFNLLHTKLFPVFKRNEAIPLKLNNET